MTTSPNKLIIDLAKLESNYNYFKNKVSDNTEISAVVKANAYGFGDIAITQRLIKLGIKSFFTATLQEAVHLDNNIQNPNIHYYVFHGFLNEHERILFSKYSNIIPVLNTLNQIESWDKNLPCSIAIDSAMNRLGLDINQFKNIKLKPTKINFIMTHFACALEGADNQTTKHQESIISEIQKLGYKTSFANSAGSHLPQLFHGNIARLGAGLYGHIYNELEHIGTLKSKIIQIRKIENDGSQIGYSGTYTAKKGQLFATIPIGYADGYNRLISNTGYILVNEKKAEVAGRVSMDLITVNVTGIQAKEGDEVILANEKLRFKQLAQWSNTIDYEITSRLGNRIDREYIN